jgi:hypothetical protein
MANRQNKKGRSKGGPVYFRVFHFVMDTPAWLSLSTAARAAYLQIGRRYNGTNNGTIGLSVRHLAYELKSSRDTASRALRELEDAGFIDTVKTGTFARRNRKASEYRLTVFRCDLSNHPPSKRFLEHGPPRASLSDHTVRLRGQYKPKTPRRYGQKARQGTKAPPHGTATRTHIESTIGGAGDAVVVSLPLPGTARCVYCGNPTTAEAARSGYGPGDSIALHEICFRDWQADSKPKTDFRTRGEVNRDRCLAVLDEIIARQAARAAS